MPGKGHSVRARTARGDSHRARLAPASGRRALESWYCWQYHSRVPSVDKIVKAMRANPQSIAFGDLKTVCEHYFGSPRQSGSSHVVFKTPWPGDPRVNIQNDKGKAKAYQVRQVLKAIDKKEAI